MKRLFWIALVLAFATPVFGQPKPKATVQNIVFEVQSFAMEWTDA